MKFGERSYESVRIRVGGPFDKRPNLADESFRYPSYLAGQNPRSPRPSGLEGVRRFVYAFVAFVRVEDGFSRCRCRRCSTGNFASGVQGDSVDAVPVRQGVVSRLVANDPAQRLEASCVQGQSSCSWDWGYGDTRVIEPAARSRAVGSLGTRVSVANVSLGSEASSILLSANDLESVLGDDSRWQIDTQRCSGARDQHRSSVHSTFPRPVEHTPRDRNCGVLA